MRRMLMVLALSCATLSCGPVADVITVTFPTEGEDVMGSEQVRGTVAAKEAGTEMSTGDVYMELDDGEPVACTLTVVDSSSAEFRCPDILELSDGPHHLDVYGEAPLTGDATTESVRVNFTYTSL